MFKFNIISPNTLLSLSPPPFQRMIAGMVFVALAFISTGLIQFFIDQNKSVLIFDEKAGIDICDQTRAQECVHGAWQIIPYILLTIGEILFSISGLNFTYEEVGKRMKASSASLWLLMVSLGNVLDVILVPALAALGFQYFFYLCAGIVLAATMIYVFIRFKYVYREDREKLSTGTPVVVVGGNNEKK